METFALGRTDIVVSPLGVGTWQWGDRRYWGYGGAYGEADVRGAFEASFSAGVTFFDTAEIYGFGESERLLGRFIQASGSRGAVVIATKYLPFPWRLGREGLVRALRKSLRRLGVGRVDLYQVHWPVPPVRLGTWADGLAEAVERGLTRAVGVSNFSAGQMLRTRDLLARRGIPLASNQVAYSLLDRGPERNGVLNACREAGITLIAYSPLAEGLLTGKYTPEAPPPGPRGRRLRRRIVRAQGVVALLREIGEARGGKTPAQVALNWLLSQGVVPIPGAKNAQQARQNAGALGWRLTAEEKDRLDRAGEGF